MKKIDVNFLIECLEQLRQSGEFRPVCDGVRIRLFHAETGDYPLCPLAALFYWWSESEKDSTPSFLVGCCRKAYLAEAANFSISAKLARSIMDAADFKRKEPKLRGRLIAALGL